MQDPAVVSTLLPALCQRVSSLGPHDRDLITLMEVLTMVGALWGRRGGLLGRMLHTLGLWSSVAPW
jgi:hypothetical protein